MNAIYDLSQLVEINLIPQKPGVYLMQNNSGEIIYVGKAKNLRQRLRSYFGKNVAAPPKVLAMISHIAGFETIICANEIEALILESTLIKQHQPLYNILLRDDRDYPYLKVTWQEEYPRIMKSYRIGDDVKQGARYYGPYQNGDLARALTAVKEIFPLKTCRLVLPRDIGKSRPCLNYHIGRCLGPCSGDVSSVQYRESIASLCDFFEGKNSAIERELQKTMRQAADNLEFEKAALLRNRLEALHKLLEQQNIVTAQKKSQDIIACAQTNNQTCLNRVQVREGRVISSVPFFFPDTADNVTTLMETFVMQHYQVAADLPDQILVESQAEDLIIVANVLTTMRGKKIEIKQPKRGASLRLLAMAKNNAMEAIEHDLLQNGRNLLAKQRALVSLASYLKIVEPIVRIEAFDIANLGAETQTAAMVVFADGSPERASYRHFQVKNQSEVNDYKAMAEIVERRLERLGDQKFGVRPNLILVDGGVGHVHAVLPLVQSITPPIAVAGIVKDDRHRTRGLALADGRVIELALATKEYEAMTYTKENSDILALWRLLTAIQNEAHRFANRILQKTKKQKNLRYSLENIAGVGPAKRRLLLASFGSIKKISEASLEELIAVTKLGESVATAVFAHFQEKKQ